MTRDHIIFGIFGAFFIVVGAGFFIDANKTKAILHWPDNPKYSKRADQVLGIVSFAFGIWFEFQTFTRW